MIQINQRWTTGTFILRNYYLSPDAPRKRGSPASKQTSLSLFFFRTSFSLPFYFFFLLFMSIFVFPFNHRLVSAVQRGLGHAPSRASIQAWGQWWPRSQPQRRDGLGTWVIRELVQEGALDLEAFPWCLFYGPLCLISCCTEATVKACSIYEQ